MRRGAIIPGALALLLAGCVVITGAPEHAATVTVFAASSLTDAFTEIGAAYEAEHPDVHLVFSFGGSHMLRTQIEAGAPADVFAAANGEEMEALVAGGTVRAEASRAFLSNKLVVIVPAEDPGVVMQLADLAAPGCKLVLAAEEVPVGSYARQSLQRMNAAFGEDFSERVLDNVVSNEDNVKQVVAKVQLGEADAGIVYRSDAVAAPDLKTIEIPADLNVIATYPIATLIGSSEPGQAAGFVEFVLSAQGQVILKKWGFSPPDAHGDWQAPDG